MSFRLFIRRSRYLAFLRHKFRHAPRLFGYVYEELNDRVIGYLIEALSGHHPGIRDLEVCQDAAMKFHALGIVHRDLNQLDFILQEKTVKLLDLEMVIFRDNEEYLKLEQEESHSLSQKLADISMIGDRGV